MDWATCNTTVDYGEKRRVHANTGGGNWFFQCLHCRASCRTRRGHLPPEHTCRDENTPLKPAETLGNIQDVPKHPIVQQRYEEWAAPIIAEREKIIDKELAQPGLSAGKKFEKVIDRAAVRNSLFGKALDTLHSQYVRARQDVSQDERPQIPEQAVRQQNLRQYTDEPVGTEDDPQIQ